MHVVIIRSINVSDQQLLVGNGYFTKLVLCNLLLIDAWCILQHEAGGNTRAIRGAVHLVSTECQKGQTTHAHARYRTIVV